MIKIVKRFKKDDNTISLTDLVSILKDHSDSTVYFLHKTGAVYQLHYLPQTSSFAVLPVVGCGTGIWGTHLLEGDHFDLWIESRMGDGTFYVIDAAEAIPGFLSMILTRGLE